VPAVRVRGSRERPKEADPVVGGRAAALGPLQRVAHYARGALVLARVRERITQQRREANVSGRVFGRDRLHVLEALLEERHGAVSGGTERRV